MSNTLVRIDRQPEIKKRHETMNIFGTEYKVLTVEGKDDITTGHRAKEFADKYQSLKLNKLDIENISEPELKKLVNLVNDLTQLVLPDLPKDILGQLTDLEKMTIIQGYFESESGRELLSAAGVQQPRHIVNQPVNPLAEFTRPGGGAARSGGNSRSPRRRGGRPY